MLFIVFISCFAAWKVADKYFLSRGKDLNRKAWESTYVERGLSVPPDGPREGYWGKRLGPKTPDPILVWHEPQISIPGLVEVDSRGLQYYRSPGTPRYRVLIIGASVAFGANASDIAHTYFNIIGKSLEQRGVPVEIVVFAGGAWKSIQEVKAFRMSPGAKRPDLVVFLNGLNDLTNGPTSRSLFGDTLPAADGGETDVFYHAQDYDQRVSDYLENMTIAQKFAADSHIPMLITLLPSLADRAHRTRIEEKLLKANLATNASPRSLQTGYEAMRKGLVKMEQAQLLHFLDCSRVFDSDRKTIFVDLWHFSDFGHEILGRAMGEKIYTLLKEFKPVSDVH